MAETYTWGEGTVWMWTGTASQSAVAFAQNTDVTLTVGYVNVQTLTGTYNDYATGQRADVRVGAMLTWDATVQRIFDAKTAVHMRFEQSYPAQVTGSAGHYLYSGRIDTLQYAGSDGGSFNYTMTYHANRWSAYGG